MSNNHPRVLFVNDSKACEEAIKLLKSNQITFAQAGVSADSGEFEADELPFLTTGEGPGWQGLDAIRRYVETAKVFGSAD